MQQRRPEVMSCGFPTDLARTVLKPLGQGHVAVVQLDDRLSLRFRRHGVLLREDEPHDVAQLDVLEEKLDVERLGCVFGRLIVLALVEVGLGDHLDVRVVRVDVHGAAEGHGDGAVSREEGPPDPLPQPFVGALELRFLDAGEPSELASSTRSASFFRSE